MEFLLFFLGFLVLLFVYGCIHEIFERILEWGFRILVRLGIKVWDTGQAQVKAHRERVEEKETLLQDPKQVLVRASISVPTQELLRPASANNIEASGELLRPSPSDTKDMI